MSHLGRQKLRASHHQIFTSNLQYKTRLVSVLHIFIYLWAARKLGLDKYLWTCIWLATVSERVAVVPPITNAHIVYGDSGCDVKLILESKKKLWESCKRPKSLRAIWPTSREPLKRCEKGMFGRHGVVFKMWTYLSFINGRLSLEKEAPVFWFHNGAIWLVAAQGSLIYLGGNTYWHHNCINTLNKTGDLPPQTAHY